jgi:type II secretory pathway component PulF
MGFQQHEERQTTRTMTIPSISEIYGWLTSAPSYLLVVLACVVLGLVLKAVPRFPNGAIPAVVVLSGGILQCLLAGEEPSGTGHRVWLIRNLLMGIIMAFVAWVLHRTVIKRFETKFPWLGNLLHTGQTEHFTNPNPPLPPSPQPATTQATEPKP